jgi:glycerol kinase
MGAQTCVFSLHSTARELRQHGYRAQNLAGVHATDVSNASRTMLMDLKSCKWSAEACAFFGVPTELLPEIRSSSERFGTISSGSLQGVAITGVRRQCGSVRLFDCI